MRPLVLYLPLSIFSSHATLSRGHWSDDNSLTQRYAHWSARISLLIPKRDEMILLNARNAGIGCLKITPGYKTFLDTFAPLSLRELHGFPHSLSIKAIPIFGPEFSFSQIPRLGMFALDAPHCLAGS
jgi:hypothetical protein